MQSLEQFQMQGYKTSMPAIISLLFCFTGWLLSISASHHSSPSSQLQLWHSGLVVTCILLTLQGLNTDLAKKGRLNQNSCHPVSNTMEWEMALSQKEQERETGPCKKSHEQRSQIHIKSPGVQPYSYKRKTGLWFIPPCPFRPDNHRY